MKMPGVLTQYQGSLLGFKVRKLRIFLRINKQELADAAGVSLNSLDLFEHNLPIPLDEKRRILKELWARKNKE
jgi:DNA-binding XRE family transcriptional regulator